MRKHRLERASAFLQPPHFALVPVLYVGGRSSRRRRRRRRGGSVVADVAAVDDEDDGVADGVVARPHGAEGVLAAYVPDLEVHVVEGDGGDVLADGGDGGFAR